MRVRLFLLGLVGACYSPSFTTGAPCDPVVDNCPSGQRCEETPDGFFCGGRAPGDAADADGSLLDDAAPDGPPVDGPPSDLDGDGIANAVDNCPSVANPTQANEDGDAFGDRCDPCPVTADNTDIDGDGVGDDCDPNPTVGGDQIAVFEGFADGLPAGWISQGTWTADSGDAVVTSGVDTVVYLTAPVSNARGTVMAALVPTTIHNYAGNPRTFGVANPLGLTPTGGVYCAPFLDLSPGRRIGVYNLANSNPAATRALDWVNNDEIIVAFTRANEQFRCIAESVATPTITADFTPNVNVTGGTFSVGVRSRGISMRARWVLYVTSP